MPSQSRLRVGAYRCCLAVRGAARLEWPDYPLHHSFVHNVSISNDSCSPSRRRRTLMGRNTTEKLRAVEFERHLKIDPCHFSISLSLDLEQAYLHIRCVFGAVRLGSELPYARQYAQFMFQARYLAHAGNQCSRVRSAAT